MVRAFVALTLLCAPGYAEDATAGIPASVELVQPTPAPAPQNSDRKDGSGAAVALAAAGAAIAGMSCAMLMKQAQEAPTESERNMLNMMAMQQCSQAAQNLANAAQNEKGKNGLTSPAGPAAPQLKSEAQQTKEAKAEPTFALPNSAVAEATPDIEVPTPEAAVAETASGVVAPEAFNGSVTPQEKAKVAGGPVTSVPKVIPKNGVEFDDDAKVGEGSTTSFGQPNFLGQGGMQNPPGNKDLKTLLTGDPREITGRKNGKGTGGDTHGEGSGGDSKDSKNEGSGDMSAMLAQLMGGGAPGGGDAGVPSNQVMNLKEFAKANGTADGEELPNVFQYASFRYRQLNQERAVRVFKGEFAVKTTSDAVAIEPKATPPKVANRKPAEKRLIGKPVAMRTASERRGGKR